MQDLIAEFVKVVERRKAEFKAMQTRGMLSVRDEHVMRAIEKRLASHDRSQRNCEFTLRQMLHDFNAKLYKPQRLVSLTYEEEERRALRSWHRFDHKLNLACFRPLEELAAVVKDPEAFRHNVRDLVIYMSDQIPMWLKIKPGKQVYAEFEIRKGNYERNLGSLSGGGSQASTALIREDDEDEVLGLNEGMTQLRGEGHKDQDKFRITVEREQICYCICNDNTEPKFCPGTTSVTFTGAHFRMSNVKWPEEVWLETEKFFVNGIQVVHEAGQPVPENLAKSLRTIRREAPEFWTLLEELNFQFYQQPSGFDDSIVCSWKVDHQAKRAKCSIRLVDSFGGGLSKD